ncbi:hypothetical protein GS504_01710 [Rhodococcus hoagii]|nr:hypothetical protein [Prescottella equi]NKS71613.1 hypothetical protein [Prescottella equi]
MAQLPRLAPIADDTEKEIFGALSNDAAFKPLVDAVKEMFKPGHSALADVSKGELTIEKIRAAHQALEAHQRTLMTLPDVPARTALLAKVEAGLAHTSVLEDYVLQAQAAFDRAADEFNSAKRPAAAAASYLD